MINLIQYRYGNDVVNIPIIQCCKLDVNNIKVYKGYARKEKFEKDEIRFSWESILANNEHKLVTQIDEMFHIHVSDSINKKKKIIAKIPYEELINIVEQIIKTEA
jgi:hypothetical protein